MNDNPHLRLLKMAAEPVQKITDRLTEFLGETKAVKTFKVGDLVTQRIMYIDAMDNEPCTMYKLPVPGIPAVVVDVDEHVKRQADGTSYSHPTHVIAVKLPDNHVVRYAVDPLSLVEWKQGDVVNKEWKAWHKTHAAD